MKKGTYNIALELPIWLFRMFILILTLIIIVAGVYMHISRKVDVSKFESQVLVYDIYSCLGDDSSGKEQLGIVKKENLVNFENCVNKNNKEAAVQMKLTYRGQETYYYINEEIYTKNNIICDKNVKIENIPYKCNVLKDYFLIEDGENIIPAFAEFTIILKEYQG